MCGMLILASGKDQQLIGDEEVIAIRFIGQRNGEFSIMPFLLLVRLNRSIIAGNLLNDLY